MNDVSISNKIIINGRVRKEDSSRMHKCRNFSSGRVNIKNVLKNEFSCILEVW